jgi:ribosomal protein S18 acetylase RimI-like enzyme
VTRLEPMDQATYDAWRRATVREYADGKVAAATWLPAEAMERSEDEFRRLLPDGRLTAGHQIRSMVDGSGQRVGHAWYVSEDRPIGPVVFIYDIAVDLEHRRKGHAQAALRAIEDDARAMGCIGVQLHVFGGNAGARELYRKAGYEETDVMMLKRVDGA